MVNSRRIGFQKIVSADYPLTQKKGGTFADEFREKGFVRLRGFLTRYGLGRFRSEINRGRGKGVRHDKKVHSRWKTSRHFLGIDAEVIRKAGTTIPSLFENPGLHAFLSGVVGDRAAPYLDTHAEMVVMILEKLGDEYGAHCDDFPFAFNIAVEVPPDRAGGLLHFAPRARTLHALSRSGALVPLEAGDAYVLHVGSSIHRVTEITKGGCERAMLSFAFTGTRPATVRSPAGDLYNWRQKS